jgi:hypothetical protein
MLLPRDRLKVVLEDARFVLGDPDAEKVAGEIVALRQRIHELVRNIFLCEVTFKLSAVGVVLARKGTSCDLCTTPALVCMMFDCWVLTDIKPWGRNA